MNHFSSCCEKRMVENNVLQEEDKQKTRDGAAGAEGKGGGKRSPGNKQTAKNLLERNEFVIFAADK